jgi:NADPH-dependent ferric siderophore reductase
VGDETALPAIGRRLEELPAGTRAIVAVETEDGQAGYPLASRATTELVWIKRNHTEVTPAGELMAALGELALPKQRCFAWAALEMQGARALRRYLIDERGFDKHWVKAAAYWQRDGVAVHAVIGDD